VLYEQKESGGIVSVVIYYIVTWKHNLLKYPKVRTVYTFRTDTGMAKKSLRLVMETAKHANGNMWMKGTPFPVPVFLKKSDAQYASRKLGIPFIRKWYPAG